MLVNDTGNILMLYKKEMHQELLSILDFWMANVVDPNGGFLGELDNCNNANHRSPKGIVLNSRILWTFSAATGYQHNGRWLQMAHRAFDYIQQHFVDREYGGVYWSLTPDGKPLNMRKQIYGIAFCIFGLSEYYKVSRNEAALEMAKSLYQVIEAHSFDEKHGGYLEALTRDWRVPEDLRLSEKDENEKKTMNTHLHVIEAYANLYTVWPAEALRNRIASLLELFKDHIIDRRTGHLNLFFDENWTVKSTLVSYGHDVEAAWLLLECAEIIGDSISFGFAGGIGKNSI